jgi:hypothetical protein
LRAIIPTRALNLFKDNAKVTIACLLVGYANPCRRRSAHHVGGDRQVAR